jgi:hypothetical protein
MVTQYSRILSATRDSATRAMTNSLSAGISNANLSLIDFVGLTILACLGNFITVAAVFSRQTSNVSMALLDPFGV